MKQQKSGLRILYVVLVWMLFLLPTVFSYAFVATDPTISLQQGKADFKIGGDLQAMTADGEVALSGKWNSIMAPGSNRNPIP